jgi:hypothetical protein
VEDFTNTVLRETGYRRCLVLDGNVRDLFPESKGRYLLLPDYLLRRL